MDIHAVPEQMQKAMMALQKGNKADAREILDVLVQEHPDDERLWLWMSWTMETREEFEQCLEQIRRINPDHPTVKRRQEGESGDLSFSTLTPHANEESLLFKRARSSDQASSQRAEDDSSQTPNQEPSEIQQILALYDTPAHMVPEHSVIPITHLIASYATDDSAPATAPALSDTPDVAPPDSATPAIAAASTRTEGTESAAAMHTETTVVAMPTSTVTQFPAAPAPTDNHPGPQESASATAPVARAVAAADGATAVTTPPQDAIASAPAVTTSDLVTVKATTTTPEDGKVATPDATTASEDGKVAAPEATTHAAPATPEVSTAPEATTHAAPATPEVSTAPEATTHAAPETSAAAAPETTDATPEGKTAAPETSTSATTEVATTPAASSPTPPEDSKSATPEVSISTALVPTQVHTTQETETTASTPATMETTPVTSEATTSAALQASTSTTSEANTPETSTIPTTPDATASTETTNSTPATPEVNPSMSSAGDSAPTETATAAVSDASTTTASDANMRMPTTPDASTQIQATTPPATSTSQAALLAATLVASAVTVAATDAPGENTTIVATTTRQRDDATHSTEALPENNTPTAADTVSPSAPTQVADSSPDTSAPGAVNAAPVDVATAETPEPAAVFVAESDSYSAPTVVATSTHLDVKDILETYSLSDDQPPVADIQARQPDSTPSSHPSPYKIEGEDHEKHIFEITLTMPDRNDLKYLLQQKVLLAIVVVIIVLTLIFSVQFLINRQKPGNRDVSSSYPRSTQVEYVHWNVLEVHALDDNNDTQNPALRYVEIYLNVQNVGTSTIHMEPLLLTDAQETMTYQPVTAHPSLAHIPEENRCDQDDIMTPDEILICRSIFEIPRNATEMKLRVSNLMTENHKTSVVSLRMPPLPNDDEE